MNDRFKFRVWSVEEKTYDHKFPFNSLGIFYIAETGRLFSDFGNSVAPEMHEDKYIIEQCTGLKDKNGNLIYEGDIVVKSDTNALGYGRIRKCNVHWHNDWLGWAITTEYGDTYGLWEYTSEHYEIVGNIHEQKDNK